MVIVIQVSECTGDCHKCTGERVTDCHTGEAVFARCLSSLKSERVEASRVLSGPVAAHYDGDRKQMIDDIKQVMYSCHVLMYYDVMYLSTKCVIIIKIPIILAFCSSFPRLYFFCRENLKCDLFHDSSRFKNFCNVIWRLIYK